MATSSDLYRCRRRLRRCVCFSDAVTAVFRVRVPFTIFAAECYDWLRQTLSRVALMESQHELLTIREVADELRVHPETVRSLLRSGRLKGIRPDTDRSELRISRRHLNDFIQRGEQRR
jgi:excisionase family DNA binding protein